MIQIYNIIDSSNDTIVLTYLIKLRSDAMVMEKPWSVLDQVYGRTSVGQQIKSDLILSTTRGIEWVQIFLWALCRASDFEFRCIQLPSRNHLHMWSSSTPEPLFTTEGYWIISRGACVFTYALWKHMVVLSKSTITYRLISNWSSISIFSI